KAKMRFPVPEQYGMISVPRIVPSMPFSVMDSNRQIIRNDAAINSTRNNHGGAAGGTMLSTSEIKAPELSRRSSSGQNTRIAGVLSRLRYRSRQDKTWRESRVAHFRRMHGLKTTGGLEDQNDRQRCSNPAMDEAFC